MLRSRLTRNGRKIHPQSSRFGRQEPQVVDFLQALLLHISGPLLIVWDRLAAHRSGVVRGFIAGQGEAALGGVSAGLRAGVEPCGIHLGVLETARIAERLSEGLLATERGSPADSTSDAPPAPSDHRILETGFFMARLTLYYAGINRGRREYQQPREVAGRHDGAARVAWFVVSGCDAQYE